jgi:integrase
VAGSTLNGHLYGLRQVWDRAKKSKIVTGDNPFSSHGIPKESVSYSPFSSEEVMALYDVANDELKLLIHAAATTGARMGELLTGEVRTPTTFNKPCWFFKFKDKGKTEQSTRVVPLHSSLVLPEGFTFKLTDRTVTRQFKELRDRIITNNIDECTGKPRKLSFHSFRTTLITELVVRQGISEKVVGAITGHLAGSMKMGSITSYINSDDLELKSQTVDRIKWDCQLLPKVKVH